jgi:hypothetical protein
MWHAPKALLERLSPFVACVVRVWFRMPLRSSGLPRCPQAARLCFVVFACRYSDVDKFASWATLAASGDQLPASALGVCSSNRRRPSPVLDGLGAGGGEGRLKIIFICPTLPWHFVLRFGPTLAGSHSISVRCQATHGQHPLRHFFPGRLGRHGCLTPRQQMRPRLPQGCCWRLGGLLILSWAGFRTWEDCVGFAPQPVVWEHPLLCRIYDAP